MHNKQEDIFVFSFKLVTLLILVHLFSTHRMEKGVALSDKHNFYKIKLSSKYTRTNNIRSPYILISPNHSKECQMDINCTFISLYIETDK